MKSTMAKLIWLALLPLATSALASPSWQLPSLTLKTPGVRSQQSYVYVPAGEHFTHVRLHGNVTAAGQDNVLSIYIDDRLQRTLSPQDGDQLDVALPDLSAGFHRVVLEGSPTTRASEHQLDVQCPPLYSLPMAVSELKLDYSKARTAPPRLADLPDALFNRTHPLDRAWHGRIDSDGSTAADQAILRLQALFRADAGVTLDSQTTNVDFVVRLQAEPALSSPAQLALGTADGSHSLPTLSIKYRDAASLNSAVNALLSSSYRAALRSDHADVVGDVAEPNWGTLQAPSSLADLGLSDTVIRGDQQLDLALSFPNYWMPLGPPSGHLVIRSQAALPQDAHLNAWLDNALAGSLPLAYLGSGDIQRSMDISGAGTPASNQVGLRLNAIIDGHSSCQYPSPGDLWLDAKSSTVDLPHRNKTGLMQSIPALVARPRIAVDGCPAALDLAVAIASAQNGVTAGKPLPYRITRNDNKSAPAPTIAIAIDPKAFAAFAEHHDDQLPTAADRMVWLSTGSGDGLRITAANSAALSALSKVWPQVLRNIPDGATNAFVDTDNGAVSVVDSLAGTALHRGGHMSHRLFTVGALAVFVIFLVAVGILLWQIRRRRGAR